MNLYLVTTIVSGWPESELKRNGSRKVAICSKFERAKEIVEKNEGDIWETDFYYAVITKVQADVVYGGFPVQEWWYNWVGGKLGGYIETQKPLEYEKVIFSF